MSVCSGSLRVHWGLCVWVGSKIMFEQVHYPISTAFRQKKNNGRKKIISNRRSRNLGIGFGNGANLGKWTLPKNLVEMDC